MKNNSPIKIFKLEKSRFKFLKEEIRERAVISDQMISVLKKHKIEVGNKINQGSKGTIYSIKNDPNKVLKVTNDESEAITSNHLKGKKLKNVVHIYDIYKISYIPNTYFIIQEKLNIVESLIKDFVWNEFINTAHISELEEYAHDIINFVKTKPIDVSEFPNTNEYLKSKEKTRTLVHCLMWIDKHLIIQHSGLDNLPEKDSEKYDDIHYDICEYLENEINDFKDNKYASRLYQLTNGMKELDKNGIYYYDAHLGNILQRNDGTLVISDLGLSQSPKEKIEILEKSKWMSH